MIARIPFEWLVVAGLVLGNVAHAQTWPPNGMAAPEQVSAVPIQYTPPVDQPSVGYPQTFNCPPAVGSDVYAQLLPENRGWCFDNDSRFDLTLHEALRGAWMRLEYLQMRLDRGGCTLGAPLAGVPDVSEQFPVTFTDGVTTALAQVPTTSSVRFNNVQGIRGSFGIPITIHAWLEARFWGIGDEWGRIDTPTIPPPTDAAGNPLPGPFGSTNTTFLATTLTTNGVPGNTIILYDQSFFSKYTVDLWSTDVNLVFNHQVPDQGWRLQSILGYRHEEYGERLRFGGVFDNNSGFLANTGILVPPESNLIDSKVINFREEVQVGLRREFAHGGFTVGVEPKMAFGTNFVRSSVATQSVRDPGNPTIDDPPTFSRGRDVLFAPTFDMDIYGKFHLTDWMNVRVGWTLIWMGNLSVADRGIRFNETQDATGATFPDVTPRVASRGHVINALTIGGEIVLP